MVLTGHEIWAHAGNCKMEVGNEAATNYLHNELENSNVVGRSRGSHDMTFMINSPMTRKCCTSPIVQRQNGIMASNQVSNVIKRVHEAAAVDFYDNAKRCRYDTGGDIEMDVDFNLGQLFAQQKREKDEEQHSFPQLQQQNQQYQQQQESQSQLMAQIFQDQNIDFCTTGHDKFEPSNYLTPAAPKFDVFDTVKSDPADYLQIDDVEYMYQTTHGGDFMRHLNNYPGEDL